MRELEAISGVFIRGDEILLPERTLERTVNKGETDLMGGDIQSEKIPVQVLLDDASEKLNITNVTILATLELESRENDVVIHRYVFICRGDYHDIHIDTDKYSNALWFNKDEIPIDNLTPHAKNVLTILGYLE